MKRHLVAQLLVILGIVSGPTAAAKTAKVNSYSCGSKKDVRQGSGWVFKSGEDVFVLTSSHVVYHSNGGLVGGCHSVFANRFESQAKLVAVDTLRGVALLKMQAEPFGNPSLPSLNSMHDIASQLDRTLRQDGDIESVTGDKVRFEGMRASSNSAGKVRDVRLLNAKSDMPILPAVPHVFEYLGHSEYGMSGGAAVAADGNYIGMLSHQYLEVTQGRVTGVGTHQPQKVGENPRRNERVVIVTLVIPATELIPWVSEKIDLLNESGEPIEWDFVPLGIGLHPKGQAKGQASLNIAELQLTEIGCVGTSQVGGQGSGIGGQGSGIGGEDGGVSGSAANIEDVLAALRSTCRIKAIPNLYALQKWPLENREIFSELYPAMKQDKRAYIAATKDENDRYHGFVTLHMALAQIENKGHSLVIVREDQLPALPADRALDVVPEAVPNSRCSCDWNELSDSYNLVYRDRDGRNHIIEDGIASLKTCAETLPRVPLCQHKVERQNVCLCQKYEGKPGYHLFKKTKQGSAIFMDTYEDKLTCEKVRSAKNECWRTK